MATLSEMVHIKIIKEQRDSVARCIFYLVDSTVYVNLCVCSGILMHIGEMMFC